MQDVLLEKSRRVAVDHALSVECDAVGIPSEEDAAADPLELMILNIRAAEQRRAALQTQGRVREDFERARDINARWKEQHPAARLLAGAGRSGEDYAC